MRKVNILATALFMATSIVGCAGKQTLSQQAVEQQFPNVAELNSAVESARSGEVNILAPEKFSEAAESLEDALQWAKAGNTKGDALAREGLEQIAVAEKTAAKSRVVLETVLTARNKAKQAGANSQLPKGFSNAEDDLKKLTQEIEKENLGKAKSGRPNLITLYRELELAALKGNTVERAKEAITQAKRNDVDNLAPKTFKLAEEEMVLASAVLDADRGNREKAEGHAETALWHAQRATQIAETINAFESADYEQEDIVLWYQNQLATALNPVDGDLAFNQPNNIMIQDLRTKLQSFMQERQNLQASLSQANQDKVKTKQQMEQQLLAAQMESQAEKKRNAEIAKKFAFVQSLFSLNEADVYRQSDNVLIRAHGFSFPSGNSQIESNNFSLLNKIIDAINQFPNAGIVVSGHTDNVGNDNLNLDLSEKRAINVAKFLSEVGKIGGQRINATGYGEKQPVASNETSDGRAANRRVEILIVNNEGA